MSSGRPTDYRPEYCELLKEHMASGLSFESFAGVVGVSKQTLYDWEKAQPAFLDAKKQAFELSRLFWEKIGIQHLVESHQGDKINSTIWIFNMKNRFNWRDKIENADTDSFDDVEFKDDE